MTAVLTRQATVTRSHGPVLGDAKSVQTIAHGDTYATMEGFEYINSGRGSTVWIGPDGNVYKTWSNGYDETSDQEKLLDYAEHGDDGSKFYGQPPHTPEDLQPFLAYTTEWEVEGPYGRPTKVWVQEHIEPYDNLENLSEDKEGAMFDRLPTCLTGDMHGGNYGINPRDPENFIMFDV